MRRASTPDLHRENARSATECRESWTSRRTFADRAKRVAVLLPAECVPSPLCVIACEPGVRCVNSASCAGGIQIARDFVCNCIPLQQRRESVHHHDRASACVRAFVDIVHVRGQSARSANRFGCNGVSGHRAACIMMPSRAANERSGRGACTHYVAAAFLIFVCLDVVLRRFNRFRCTLLTRKDVLGGTHASREPAEVERETRPDRRDFAALRLVVAVAAARPYRSLHIAL
ncbi:hypothetical protein SAMN05192539_100575 [Paraburkholderia diazotrophica]|uniref:Uncharacterized protein n=1 Tax=Paraburkholderia diazotrophica TaxID=667676 RepID=A0A1H6UKB5_9BURK|nr:hypothetical protein SAMN05192539_100575 [Paraburkholderia diazotrophica]